MAAYIRDESGMRMSIPSDDMILLDLETLMKQRGRWQSMRSPEYALFSPRDKTLYLVEAKMSAPRRIDGKKEKEVLEHLLSFVDRDDPLYNLVQHSSLSLPLEVFCARILEKYQSALLALLSFNTAEWKNDWRNPSGNASKSFSGIEGVDCASIKLILIVRNHDISWLPALDDIVRGKVKKAIYPWMRKVSVSVMNADVAKQKGFILELVPDAPR